MSKENICPDCYRPEHRGKCESLSDRAMRNLSAQADRTAARIKAEADQAAKDDA